jgi:hypothetical protein
MLEANALRVSHTAARFAALGACSTPHDPAAPNRLTDGETRQTLLNYEIERTAADGEGGSIWLEAFDADGSWATSRVHRAERGACSIRNGRVCVTNATVARRECWRLLRAGDSYFIQAASGGLEPIRLIPLIASGRGGAVLHRLSSEEIAEALTDKCYQRLEYSGGIDLALSYTEYFNSDGAWGQRADRIGSVQGRYSVSSGLVCVQFASGVGNCRRMMRDDTGQLYAQNWPSGGLPPIRVRTFTSRQC